MKKVIALLLALILCLGLCACESTEEKNYKSAVSSMEAGQYEEAISLFEELGEYKDAAQYVVECKYKLALEKMEDGEYDTALAILSELGEYEDSGELVKECHYQAALNMLDEKKYSEAIEILGELGDYKDCANLLSDTKWDLLYQYIRNNGGAVSYGIGNNNSQTLYLQTNDDGTIDLFYDGHEIFFVISMTYQYQLTLHRGSEKAEYIIVCAGSGINKVSEQLSGDVMVSSFTAKMAAPHGMFIQTVTEPNGDTKLEYDYSKSSLISLFFEELQKRVCDTLPLLLEKTETGITASDLGFSF